MKKMKLKLDEDGNKITQVKGIRAGCKVVKSRYAKPFESVQVHIPYDTGMDPYSGLFDMFLDMDILKKDGNSYVYASPVDGEVLKMFKKAWNKNENGGLDRIMAEFSQIKKAANYNIADKANPLEEEVDLLNIEIQEEV